jgi:metacaspase-1
MKKTIFRLSIVLLALFTLVTPNAVMASQPEKVDKYNPVFARDVELAKKVQVKGDKPAGKPQKPAAGAATGTLGDPILTNGNKYAIVIGISNYPGTNNDLNYCDDDAVDMIAALKQYGFTDNNIFKFIDSESASAPINATRESIISAIDALDEIDTANDEIVFFFSGHGGRGKADDFDTEVTDECIWVHDSLKLVPIWDGELAKEFSTFLATRIIFIFDSCYAGGMTDLKKDGRVIAMASGENSLSAEFATLSNGEFTHYMIEEGMYYFQADKYDHDGLLDTHDVTVEEAWDYAKLKCSYDIVVISDLFPKDLLP